MSYILLIIAKYKTFVFLHIRCFRGKFVPLQPEIPLYGRNRQKFEYYTILYNKQNLKN